MKFFVLIFLLLATPVMAQSDVSTFFDAVSQLGSERHEITLWLESVDFETLVGFEDELKSEVPEIREIDRRSFGDNTAELMVYSTVSAQDLSTELIKNFDTDLEFTIFEYTDNFIAISFSEFAEQAYSGQVLTYDPSDTRLRVAFVAFDDPYRSGLAQTAGSDVSRFFSRMNFVNYISTDVYVPQSNGLDDWLNSNSRVGSPVEMFDWVVGMKVNTLRISTSYNPPIFDRETGCRIVDPSWDKYMNFGATLEIFDLNTGEYIYRNSINRYATDHSYYTPNLRTDFTMAEEVWDASMSYFYIDILDLLYRDYNVPPFVAERHPDQSDRAIINVGSNDGIYEELPMRLYIPGTDENGEFEWDEVCKVTVKEVHEKWSVIECEEKWFEYFEFGQDKNIVWPAHPSSD